MRFTLVASLMLLGACSAPQPAVAPQVARATAAPSASTVPSASNESFTMESKALHETRRINIHRPAAPLTPSTTVLYMPDGGVEEDFPHVAAAVDAAIAASEMAPVVVVGVENTQRRRDMTPPTEVASDKEIAPVVGGSAAFRAFFRDELMPEVRRRLGTNGRTAIIGESLAGLFVVDTLCAAPDTFDVYIALSPSLWWNASSLVKGAHAWREQHPRVDKTLYLTIAGDDDRDDAVAGFHAFLEREAPAGLRWTFEPRPEATHATIYRASEAAVLRRMFPPK